jgi:hypothetical protein
MWSVFPLLEISSKDMIALPENDVESRKLSSFSVRCSNMAETGWDSLYQGILKESILNH